MWEWEDLSESIAVGLRSTLVIAASDEASQQDECWLRSAQVQEETSVFTIPHSAVWGKKKLLLRFIQPSLSESCQRRSELLLPLM